MVKNVSGGDDAARQAALAQARREALEAARARLAAERAQAAAQQQAAMQQAKPAPVARDASRAQGEAMLEAHAGATGDVPLPPAPGGAEAGGLMAAMAAMAPAGQLPKDAAAFVAALRSQLEGRPQVAAGAVTQTLLAPEAFYRAGQAMKGTPQMATSEADMRAVANLATADHLAAQLKAEPDLSTYPAETIKQLASFREFEHPALQSAIDGALKTTFDGDLKPDAISQELAYMAHKSTDAGVMPALEGKMKAWADTALKDSMDGKKKESGVEDGLKEFEGQMVKLAERTGMGDVVQRAAETALKDGEGIIKDTAERGRSLFDRFTGAIGGFIDGAFGAIGDGIKSAIGAVGDVASFAIDKVGDVAELGLDLAAAGLDAVGADGAADFTRKTGDAVNDAYDWVGKQADGFVDGVGDALGDTVIGVGSVIAHPIDTVKGIAHLVANPSEIVTVGKALWATASEGGIAHAIGYVAGNIAPALLTGGSSSGASLTARLGAVAGESRVLTTLANGAKASRVAQTLSRGGALLAKTPGLEAIGRAGSLASRVGGKAVTFVKDSRFGQLAIKAGEELRIPQIVQKFKDAKLALNDGVDRALGAQVRRLDDTALGRGVERALPNHVPQTVTTEARLAELAKLGPQKPIPLSRDAEGVIKQRGADGDAVYNEVGADGAQLNNPNDRTLGEVARERGLHGEAGEIQRLKDGDRLQGTFSKKRADGRPMGNQPDIVSEFGGPVFKQRIGDKAKAIGADPTLTPQQKLDQVNELVNQNLRANFSTDDIKALDEYHDGLNAAGRHVTTEDYLQSGLADCRGYATIHQMALQEAGFRSGIAVSKTVLEDVGGAVPAGLVREADGLSHYYNVVQIDGKQLIADAFNPAASGHELADALTRGFVDRQGGRVVHYQPGSYGATVLNDGLGSPLGASAVVAPAASAALASREDAQRAPR